MTDLFTGADAERLERAAAQLRAAADDLDAQTSSLTSTLHAVAWVGGVATRFESRWRGGHRPRVRATADAVRSAAEHLERNAAEQRAASRAHATLDAGGSVSSPPTAETSHGRDDDVVGRLERFLDGVGVAGMMVEVLVEGAEQLDDLGYVHRLLDVLTSDAFTGALAGLEVVVDHREVIVDLVADFLEQPHLPIDERIVHAVADAAVRFGVGAGMEQAAEWAGSAALAALLPGAGAVLAPIVGHIAGEVVGTLAELAVDAIDGATDGVDLLADAVVDAYRAVKDEFGVVLDVVSAAGDVVVGAADLAVDVGGALVDAGGAAVEVGGDVVGAVGGFVGGLLEG